MRLIIAIVGYLFVLNASAQSSEKHQYISLTYSPNRAYVEQAVETIETASTVLAHTTVDYRAGHSVALLPGFEARQGAVFTAHIQQVAEGNLRLMAYPNPVDKSTTISFNLPEAGLINLFVVDERGQVVEQLMKNSLQTAGAHQFEWHAASYSSGIYIPVLRTERQQTSSRVIKK